MILLKYTHYTGYNELDVSYNKDEKEVVFCAIGRDKEGNNIAQVDLGSYSWKKVFKKIKKLKKLK